MSGAAASGPEDRTVLRAQAEIRALVAVLVEVMSGRRPADQVAMCLHSAVRTTLVEWLRSPARARFSGAAVLRRIRLSAPSGVPGGDGGGAIEAMALVQDGSRMRAVAFRFDVVVTPAVRHPARSEVPRWMCTALQAA
jgi:hypothetical protein